jgi:hypothetical protein
MAPKRLSTRIPQDIRICADRAWHGWSKHDCVTWPRAAERLPDDALSLLDRPTNALERPDLRSPSTPFMVPNPHPLW